MEPDELNRLWQLAGHEIPFAAGNDRLLEAVVAQERSYRRSTLLRDAREIGTCVLSSVGYTWVGRRIAPESWAFPITGALLLLPAWFMVIDRIFQNRKEMQFGATLRETVERSLDSIEHQILLLRTALLWYGSPAMAAVVVFIGRLILFAPTFWTGNLLIFCLIAAFIIALGFSMWYTNKQTIETKLKPRQMQLKAILDRLKADNAPQDVGV